MAEKLKWPIDAFREFFKAIKNEGMAKADWDAQVVWVPNAIHYNEPESPNVVKSWATTWNEIPECPLKKEAFTVLKNKIEDFGKGFQKAFQKAFQDYGSKNKASTKAYGKAYAKSMPNQEQEQEQEQEQKDFKGKELKTLGSAQNADPESLAAKTRKIKGRTNPKNRAWKASGQPPIDINIDVTTDINRAATKAEHQIQKIVSQPSSRIAPLGRNRPDFESLTNLRTLHPQTQKKAISGLLNANENRKRISWGTYIALFTEIIPRKYAVKHIITKQTAGILRDLYDRWGPAETLALWDLWWRTDKPWSRFAFEAEHGIKAFASKLTQDRLQDDPDRRAKIRLYQEKMSGPPVKPKNLPGSIIELLNDLSRKLSDKDRLTKQVEGR